MRENEIEKMKENRIIAEFMGDSIELRPAGDAFPGKRAWYYVHEKRVAFLTLEKGLPNELDEVWMSELPKMKFHKSWDALMPVVEKIESIYDEFHGYFGVYISSNSCTIHGTRLSTDPDNPHYAYMNNVVLDTKLESTYHAAISFIQWYNTQSKPE